MSILKKWEVEDEVLTALEGEAAETPATPEAGE